jgi:hypothetical protein
MFSEDFEVCWFGVEADLCVGPVAEWFVVGASASAQGSEHLAVQVDQVRTVLSRLDLYCMDDRDDSMDSI